MDAYGAEPEHIISENFNCLANMIRQIDTSWWQMDGQTDGQRDRQPNSEV